MMALSNVSFAALVVFCVFAAALAKPVIPKHVSKLLQKNREVHMKYFPDFKYEGFTHPHEDQPEGALRRRGTSPDDVQVHDPPTPDAPNIHMANKSFPYPDNLLWLLAMFEEGYGIPRSYNDVLPTGDVYWGTKTYLEVGAFDANGNHTSLDSILAIQERTLTRYGLNLYDAAVWEIALSLWWLHDVAIIYEDNILYPGSTGPAGAKGGNPGGITSIRADTDDYKYGYDKKVLGSALKQIHYPANVTHFPEQHGEPGAPTKKGPGAFFYRMIGPKYTMVDPMMGAYGQSWKYPWPNYDKTTTWNTFGIIHFNDWKPITGENVWSAILGPIQSLGLRTNGNLTNTTCGSRFLIPPMPCDWTTFEKTPSPVQLAISILPALEALQSEPGSLYHCPWGSKIFPPDPNEGANVSNENNFSSYASLTILLAVLKNYTKGSTDEVLNWALKTTQKLVDGLDKWFDNPSILSPVGQLPNSSQVVPQGGHINSSGYFPVPLNTKGGLAVDCQTWGMTVLGQPRIDKNFGFGTAYNIWQTAKAYAGYYKGSVLAGVGYTDIVNTSGPVPVNTIWSAEWTFGAINMAQVLAQQYHAAGDDTKADSLMNDAQSMYFEVTKEWPKGLRFPDGSYVYANKRFFIPWGWFSNPISALCSTAWSVLQDQNFNPFEFGGGNKPPLQPPPHLGDSAPMRIKARQYPDFLYE
jgi:hypothetical protein